MRLCRKRIHKVTVPDVLAEQERLERAKREHEQVVAERPQIERMVSDVKKVRQQNGIGEALDAIFRRGHHPS
jgi:hypothetical protein